MFGQTHLSYIFLGVLLLYAHTTFASENRTDAKPNIVIVLVDDMGFSDIGCYGGEIDTPNLDRMAERGIRFTQFYNSGRCCPTRASLLTGLHPHQVGIGHMTAPPNKPLGITGAYQGYLNDQCTTLASVLRSAGYRTLMSGKWHLGLASQSTWPLQRGFDRFYGGLSGAFNYMKPGGDRKMTRDNQPAETDSSFYATDTFTDVACQFISDTKNEANGSPFFLYLAYNAPHWPLQPKWKEYQKYRGQYTGGWPEVMAKRLAKQKRIGLFDDQIVPAPHVGPEWNSLTDQQRDEQDAIMAAYAGCIDSIDQNMGKLIRHLESIGELDNTVIFFLSDNGSCHEGGKLGKIKMDWPKNPPLETTDGIRLGMAWANASNTPFRLYKHFVHEGGACTPMIAFWPAGIAPEKHGSFVRRFAYLPDFMATCIDLSGAKYPDGIPACEGKSFLSILQGSDAPIHTEPIYWEHEGNASMRSGKWKLVREYKKPWELYDISVDRTEMHNLAATEPSKIQEMTSRWEAWATKNGVAYPKRFNMYEFLRKRDGKKNNKNKKSKSEN